MTGAPAGRRRVGRGEGEVTEWPRGLVDYVGTGPEETPSPDDDRTHGRLLLAARLAGLLRAEGVEVREELEALSRARAAEQAGDRERARALVEQALGALDAQHRRSSRPTR